MLGASANEQNLHVYRCRQHTTAPVPVTQPQSNKTHLNAHVSYRFPCIPEGGGGVEHELRFCTHRGMTGGRPAKGATWQGGGGFLLWWVQGLANVWVGATRGGVRG